VKRKTTLLVATLLFVALAFSATLVAAQGEEPSSQETPAGTIYDIIRSEDELQSFRLLVDAAALADNLDRDGPFTVFAPTNAAMEAIQDVDDETDKDLTDILLYHVVNGRYPLTAARRSLVTLDGDRLLVDAAASGEATVNGQALVVTADIEASNGIVHIVDAVLPVPAENDLFASELGSASESIPDVLAEDGRFDTFLALAAEAGLLETLDGAEKMTLFAPTDEAFAAVPEEMMAEWQADPAEALWTILAYHVVQDELGINQIANDEAIPTLEGRVLTVTTDDQNQVFVNGRAVVEFNLLAANGVIHVVDEVLLP
jgi:transforming growth factor-beta-induced protein